MVGRSEDCAIVLRDERKTVSRQHAILSNSGNELRLRDNDSKNGTQVNGNYVPYHVETLLSDGTEITFGECIVRVRREHRQEAW